MVYLSLFWFSDTKILPAKARETSEDLPDSLNFFFKVSRDTLIIGPREGSWVNSYYSYDIVNKEIHKPLDGERGGFALVTEDYEAQTDRLVINKKLYVVKTEVMFQRAVYNKKPLRLNLNGDRNQYIIFGVQGHPTKRYFYKKGKVIWIPET